MQSHRSSDSPIMTGFSRNWQGASLQARRSPVGEFRVELAAQLVNNTGLVSWFELGDRRGFVTRTHNERQRPFRGRRSA